MPQKRLIPALLVAALCAWLITLAMLLARPGASLDAASGLYAVESHGAMSYRWSGDRVVFPITRQSGPTELTLRLDVFRWAGRAAPRLGLGSDSGGLAQLSPPPGLRRYRLVLPPGATTLTVESTVDLPPGGDPRWLGVEVYSLSARPSGIPIGLLWPGLALLAIYLALALALAWAVRRGLGAPLLIFGLALALRSILIQLSPPGWRTDEVVSLVDAWNLAHTGRDHLGHLLPLGAFEALGDWISPLLTYLELPFVAIFGPQPLVGRLVTVVVGALAAPLGYALARELGLARVGMVATGLAMALSPWQIFISRTALPPALVPTFWTLCLLAGVSFVQSGSRRSTLGLALAAGLALYAYPTLKLAAPLLVALAVALATLRGTQRWWLPRLQLPAAPGALVMAGLLLALLWAPFVYVTLFNPASATRLSQAALQADSWGTWLGAWWSGYAVYFTPDFYYRFGDGTSNGGIPGFGVELWASLPLLLLGLVGLGLSTVRFRSAQAAGSRRQGLALLPTPAALFVLGAILIAALPSSLTTPSPHTYRGASLAPLYALLVGYGAAILLPEEQHAGASLQRRLRQLVALALAAGLLWQGAIWWRAYTQDYPPLQAGLNQDGLPETIRRAVALASQYNQVWVSSDSIDEPYLYVLAAQPFSPAEAQRLIVVERRPGHFNAITRLGPYRFVDTSSLPANLPTLAAIPGAVGGRGYVLQEWMSAGQRILVLRKM